MPNPADESIMINYNIIEKSNYSLSIYNSLGLLIKTLFTADLDVGSFEIIWNTLDDKGNLVPNGIYYIRLKSDKINYTKSVTILR
jgi:flagellar hook assembly protein FlgD